LQDWLQQLLSLTLWDIRKRDVRIFTFSVLIAPPNLSSRAATAQQINNENHECNHQQHVNQTSGYVKTDSQKPENQKNRHNPPS
jgi:hypothetical protein